MATAATRTLLPLDRFFELISYSPILASQVYIPDLQQATCSDPLLQNTWQYHSGGLPSREEIALAIAQAEDQISRYLHFHPAPKWTVDEIVVPVRKPGGGFGGFYGARSWLSACWYEFSVQSQHKHFIQGGREAYTLIDDNVTIIYSDEDGDGYDETATVQVTTALTDANEIAVFYPDLDTDHDEAWEIRPVKTTFSGGLATIKFKRHQAVLKNLIESLAATGVNGLDDANFLSTVDVYRRYNDPSRMAIIEWSPAICNDAACEVSAQEGCISPRDARNAIINVHAADWDADTSEWTHICPTWWTHPARVRLWHRSGFRDQNKPQPMNNMNLQLEQAIAFLALSLMDREWQTCEPMHNLQARWRTDLAQRTSNPSQSLSFQLSRSKLENPLGTTRAAMFAWDVIQRFAVGEAVTAS